MAIKLMIVSMEGANLKHKSNICSIFNKKDWNYFQGTMQIKLNPQEYPVFC